MPKFSFFLNNEQCSNWIIQDFKKQGDEKQGACQEASSLCFFCLKGVAYESFLKCF